MILGNRKAQSAIEFMILIGVAMVFFIVFLISLQDNLSLKIGEQKDVVLREVASTVQSEISLAYSSADGYSREFFLPERIIDVDYDISIVDGGVYVRTVDGKHALTLPTKEVLGEIQKGTNLISKDGGVVYLNSQ